MAYLTTQSGQPVLILKEGTGRRRGREAQKNNIMAARIIAEALRTTLGPRGMDKMLVDSIGDVTITNDGAAILKEIDVEHPAAKIMVEVAKAQDNQVGDGTTTAVVLAGELLKKAEELLDQNIHPTIIVSGYRKAVKKALETLENLGIPVDLKDHEMLMKVAKTSMGSKAIKEASDHFAELAIKAVETITEKRGERNVADIDNIQVIKKEGKSLLETELINGVVLEKEVVHPGMPKRVEDAKIALIRCPLEVEKTEYSAEIRIRDPTQVKAFLDQETKMLQEMINKIKSTGANVVICQKGIDDMAQYFMAREGILAVRRAKESDLEKLAKATGGKIVTNLDDLTPETLGYASLVEERKVGDDKLVFIRGCKNPKSVSILIRGGLERMVDEAERALHDALCVVRDVVEKPKIVAGGGAIETELAKHLREYAREIGGREQLAIEAFADALEVVPKTLAENAGLDSLDIMVSLRAEHEKEGGEYVGINVFTGKTINTYEAGVIEPIRVKEHAIKSAEEAASMIIRIDDVIAASRLKEEEREKAPKPPEAGGEF